MDYYCCDAHHSSYCPECCGETCLSRLKKLKNKKIDEPDDSTFKEHNPMMVVNLKESE